jgi:glycosyltransferase involved in cell wall biosynthesis
VHTFHAKPTIFGGLNTYLQPKPLLMSTITGLGHAFIEGGYTRTLSALGYRLALRKNAAVIFQNPDDMQFFLERGWLSPSKAKLIHGSGVDTSEFRPNNGNNRANDPVRVLMVTRLIWQKGVREYVAAAEALKEAYPEAQFYLAGEWDEEHPDGIPREWIQSSVSRGSIKFLGYLEKMPEELRRADIFVLPSYREGLPRVLLEASACGLPVITTDTPGCRDAVLDGVTGILIPSRDHRALAEAIRKLIESPNLRKQMGQQGRGLIEDRHDIKAITGQYLDLYASLGVGI